MFTYLRWLLNFSTKKNGPRIWRVYVLEISSQKNFCHVLGVFTCLCIWDFSKPKKCPLYLMWLCIWDIPPKELCHVFDVFTCSHIWDFSTQKNVPHIWRVYVFEISSKKFVCHVFDVFTCLRIWDFLKKMGPVFDVFTCLRIWVFSHKKETVFDMFMYLRFQPKNGFAMYLTYLRVYVFEIWPDLVNAREK